MSSELKPYANLVDLGKIKTLLQNSVLETGAESVDSNENWLQCCKSAISPTGELVVFARAQNIVVLTQKWDSAAEGDVKMKYVVSWQGRICQQPNEEITSVLCLPLISQGQSRHGGADWTCIVLGFSTGYIRFYTESVNFLVSELLHNEPVTHIKCISYSAAKVNLSGFQQEPTEVLYVLYKTVLCHIPGFSLFQTLRACRNQLARVRANMNMAITTASLDLKKYGFNEHDSITDACLVGQTMNSTFDHLVTASLCGGFHSSYKPSPPQTSLIVATGRKPFVGFHYTIEGGGGPVLTHVAKAVASKLKNTVTSALPDWFGISNKKQTTMEKDKDAAIEPAEQLGCRFGLCDLWRHGDIIVTSPDRRLSAVSDTLGRVLLIDNRSGVAVRLWKGYRDAECGFLEVAEDLQKTRHRKSKHSLPENQPPPQTPRHALFIVIYSPKKGLVEVFVTQQGPRVASFLVSKQGKLLYTPHGLVGLNAAPSKSSNSSQVQLLFLDEEGFKEVVVPFHFALSDSNSEKARDLHVLKKLKRFLREENYSQERLIEEVEKRSSELKTDDVRMQLLELLCTNKHITVDSFMVAINALTSKIPSTGTEGQELEQSSRNILLLCEQLKKLLTFYKSCIKINKTPPNYNSLLQYSTDSTEQLQEQMLMSEKDLNMFLTFIQSIQELEAKTTKKRTAKVTIQEAKSSSLVDYLSCFDFEMYLSSLKNDSNDKVRVFIKSTLKAETLRVVGDLLYSGVLHDDSNIHVWNYSAKESNIDTKCLIKCLLYYWLDREHAESVTYELFILTDILKSVCSLEDCNVIIQDYNKVSTWWLDIRSMIAASSHTLPGLLAAVSCRAVTILIEQQAELDRITADETNKDECVKASKCKNSADGASSSTHDWETVSKDTCEWDIFITQLEDITLLNTILKIQLPVSVKPPSAPLVQALSFDSVPVSLRHILTTGKCSVSELVVKWLAKFTVDPVFYIDPSDVEFDVGIPLKKEKKAKKGSGDEILLTPDEAVEAKPEDEYTTLVLEYLSLLKKKFPYSLSSSVLLSNLCWEFMSSWYKNVEELDRLTFAIRCLQAIPSIRIKYGIAYLSWTTYVKQYFENISKLIQKIGKLPKEMLCKQESNLSNLQIPTFYKNTTDLLNIMSETNGRHADTVAYSFSNYENIWINEETSGCPNVVNLALNAPEANDDLLLLHYQLSLLFLMICSLNLRLHRPFSNIFDNMCQSELFSDLTKTTQLPSHCSDNKLRNNRLQVLFKVVTGAVQTITLSQDSITNEVKTCSEDAAQWVRNAHELATMWGVSVDDLRRHQACELYSNGFDRLAEEVVSSVSDRAALASQLVVVAGQRLQAYIVNSPDLFDKITNLSPALSSWLASLDTNTLKNHSSSLSNTSVILSYVLHWLPESHSDLQLAIHMVDALQGIDNNNTD